MIEIENLIRRLEMDLEMAESFIPESKIQKNLREEIEILQKANDIIEYYEQHGSDNSIEPY